MVSVLDEFRALVAGQSESVSGHLMPCVITHVDSENGFVRLEFAEQPAFRNHFGNIQGGFAVAMLDVVVAIAAYAKVRAWLPTIEIKCSFLEPLPLGTCVGEGRVLKVGNSVAFIEGRLLMADGRPGATATATLLVRVPKI
jgi:uncharacterized protein (TIGR00369 family)